jgi:hypothetical protein
MPQPTKVLMLLVGLAFSSLVEAADSQIALCPSSIATLTPVPGNLNAEFAAERVEIRRCTVDAAKLSGLVQLAAWEEGATKPAFIIDLEDSGFYQIAMIQGVYAFEIIGGKASRIIVISFNDGMPQVALDETSLSHPVIQTDADSLTVVTHREAGQTVERRFNRTGKAAGRK